MRRGIMGKQESKTISGVVGILEKKKIVKFGSSFFKFQMKNGFY